MNIVLIVLLVTAAGAVLTAQIRKDGYGSRPAPRSHYDYFEANSLTN
ncbi:hypothetical protein J2X11_001920 [Aeromicrobium panaciterrae]|uniref:Uncharacterized protein n=1 Tax=Aeromicrobium panaciterrae TaxID=363861 RepID=A0ABU1UPH3_9ACTN|nr:hypothetical protein [Aeromicrobium panaciterrae]MDR7087081.1 hypothetical protein [Aeromicrobium panaciterrae]